jgi:hypothetical protein
MLRVEVPEDNPTIEPGTYAATFAGAEERASDSFGTFWLWRFTVDDVEVAGISSPKLTKTAKARAWAEALVGRPLEPGEVVDFETLTGRPCTVVVEHNGAGFPKVVDVRPAPRPEPIDETLAFAEVAGTDAADDLPF